MSALQDEMRQVVAPLEAELRRLAAKLDTIHRALPPQYVTLEEAAQRMHVSTKTATRRCRTGEWPSRRDGRKTLVDMSDLHAMMPDEIASAATIARQREGGQRGEA